ncbi:hypothetical protein TASIC1_0002006400 [Trichoderma asperellum]|uniref:Uncharacterized protein n=1 Tax=Trichoderma asperellum TaxID=101201 RepID=A0A6V8QK75_TRIAP|nr:hypothetical protein TASIC1_0002006400 [Trichoderma asperellum]
MQHLQAQKKEICQTCLRLGLECVQFDIFCPINVVTPTRDSRPTRAATDGEDQDEANHSSPSSSSSADDAGGSSDAAESSPSSSSSAALIPATTAAAWRQSELMLLDSSPLSSSSSSSSSPPLYGQQQIVFRTRGSASAMRHGPSMAGPVPSLSAFSYLSTNQYFFLQYYLERLSNVLVNANSDSNPLKSLILPRIASSNLLLDAICATASLHRSSASDADPLAYSDATRYYVRVLSAVRDLIPQVTNSTSKSLKSSSRGGMMMISDGESSPGGSKGSRNGKNSNKNSKAKKKTAAGVEDVETAEMAILASIFLCKYEIIKDGVESWRFHLKGIESLCRSLSPEQTASMANTLAYVRSFMSYHKNIARITEYAPHSTGEEFEHEPFELGKLFPVDPYMGFSQSLIILLGRVSNLLVINTRDGPHELRREIETILSLLARRSWDADRFAIPEGMGMSTIENSTTIAEAYYCAIIACIHAVLEVVAEREAATAVSPMTMTEEQFQFGSPPLQPSSQAFIDWASLHALLPVAKADALTECLAGIARVPLGAPEEAGLLPLLFIVACETSREDQAHEALLRVEALGSHIGLGNVRCASELLKQVWLRRSTQRDFHDWRGLLAQLQWDLIIT